jgi:hypothetical protein
MELPDTNNVYGHFSSHANLEKLAAILRRRLFFDEDEVTVYKSSFDGCQTIRITNQIAEFESTKFDNEGTYSLNGAVAGSEKEIFDFVSNLFTVLKQHGYNPVFEIYDEWFNCIKEFTE